MGQVLVQALAHAIDVFFYQPRRQFYIPRPAGGDDIPVLVIGAQLAR
jgi:hypothetical protein